jgi:hypothetical protein
VNTKLTAQQVLEKARAEAAEAQARAQVAQAAVERQAHEADVRRQKALAEWDQRALDEYDYPVLTREVAETRDAFRQAVLEDPLNQAAIAHMAALRRRVALQQENFDTRRRLGLVSANAQAPSVSGPDGLGILEAKYLPELMDRILNEAVNNVYADLMDEREADREQAGEAAARGETGSPVT